jgi:hypothetical protein
VAYTEFTVRSGGSNLYAGTLDGSAEAATTPLVTYTNGGWNSGTGVFTPASGNPVSAGVAVGNFVSVYTDGAGAPTGFVARVTAVSSTTITLSTTAKSGTAPTTAASGITAVVGGAWAGPSGTSGFPLSFVTNTLTNTSGDPTRVNLKNDQTYSITAAITAGNTGLIYFQGYTSTFGDGGRFTVDGGTSGASYTLLTLSAGQVEVRDAVFQNNGATGTSNGVSMSGASLMERVKVTSVRGSGFAMLSSGCAVIECEATACNQGNSATLAGFGMGGGRATRCVAHDNTGSNNRGFRLSTANAVLVDCVSDTNGNVGFDMAGGGSIHGGVAYANGGPGVLVAASVTTTIENVVLANNGTFGATVTAGGFARLISCAFRSNTSGETSGVADATGTVTLTADPFTDAANRDFSLNDTAGGGAACRGAGRGTFPPSDPTVGYPDIGAAQHQDAGGSSGGFIIGG